MSSEKPQWKRLTREEQKQRKERIKKRKADATSAHLEKYGKPTVSGAFSWTLVELYKTGHVRVGGGAMLELRGIEFTDLSQRKNQIGRVVGFLGTAGLNMFTSTRKGEAILSIVTSSGVKTLKTSEARPSDIETAHKLAAASKALVGHVESDTKEKNQDTDDLPAQLQKLHELKESGALTEKEFAAAKKKLLQ